MKIRSFRMMIVLGILIVAPVVFHACTGRGGGKLLATDGKAEPAAVPQ